MYEFVVLYDLNCSEEVYPFWKFDQFQLENIDEAQCRRDFHFSRQHVSELKDTLNISDKVVTSQKTVATGIDALCIRLKRLTFPCHYTNRVPLFGRNVIEICLIFNYTLDYIYSQHNHLFYSWQHSFLQPSSLQQYADFIHAKCAPLQYCFGFTDGTAIEICRPTASY